MGAKLVMGTSTKPEKRARLKDYGCDLAFDSRDPKWPDQVIEATGGKGVDLIIDLVSAGVANDNMKATRVLGRIVNIGRLGGFKGEFDFDLHALAAHRLCRRDLPHPLARPKCTRSSARMRADLWPLVEAGKFSVPIDRTFPLAEAAAAQAHMRSNAHFGKIVLTVGS